MSQTTQSIRDIGSAPTRGSEELLKDTLKRCSKETLEAALAYRESGDVSYLPIVVMGIIERFLDPDEAELLRQGNDSARFMEDLGLDSLTMIEAVMMVEESLGVSIKNEELMNLRSVGDMKAFIENKITGLGESKSSQFLPFEEVAAIMPQQNPFLFLSEATLNGKGSNGKYWISGKESFLQGHFKDDPVFPASIMLESLGQLAVLNLLKKPPSGFDPKLGNESKVYFTGADGVRCFRVCKPGETLELSVELKRVHQPLAVFSGEIRVGGEKAVVAEEITLAFEAKPEVGGNGVNGHHSVD